MSFLKNISIKNKIIFIIFSISSFILILGFSIIIINNISSVKDDFRNVISAEAKLVGDYCITPLEFDYPDKGEENLSKLKTIPDIKNSIIFDADGKIFAAYNRDTKDYKIPVSRNESYHEFEGDYIHVFEPITFQGKRYGVIYIRAFTGLSDKTIENVRIMVYLISGLLLFALLLALWMQKIISGPILELASTTEVISRKGDFSLRVEKKRTDEIGILYDEFNLMLEQIHLREEERDKAEALLKESEMKYRRLTENAKDMIYRMSIPGGEYEFVSKASLDLFGYMPDEFYNSPMLVKKIIHPEWHGYFEEQWKKLLRGEMPPSYEYKVINRAGDTKWMYQRNVLVKNEKGYPVAIEGIVTDITDRKKYEHEMMNSNIQLENRVKERTQELENAYNELAEFAYITSHDLKTPLRGISQPAQWLLEDYRQMFDDNAVGLVNLILNRVKRMDKLINGILRYLKFGNVVQRAELVDIQKVVRQAIESVAPPDNIKITYNNFSGSFYGDRLRLEQVILSLLENSVNFMDKENGVIEIECREISAGILQFCVKDNGPGIDRKYHDKIFNIFQTLDNKETSENIGIGLAIAKKIVEQSGGSIWLDSELGAGSAFYFTVNKQ